VPFRANGCPNSQGQGQQRSLKRCRYKKYQKRAGPAMLLNWWAYRPPGRVGGASAVLTPPPPPARMAQATGGRGVEGRRAQAAGQTSQLPPLTWPLFRQGIHPCLWSPETLHACLLEAVKVLWMHPTNRAKQGRWLWATFAHRPCPPRVFVTCNRDKAHPGLLKLRYSSRGVYVQINRFLHLSREVSSML
jgi:hypothetical protein